MTSTMSHAMTQLGSAATASENRLPLGASALATEPLRGERRGLMTRFRCLRREDFVAAPISETLAH